jgi:hypothetical protein
VPEVRQLRFGHGVTVSDKPSGYFFLPELAGVADTQVLIEAVQPSLVPQEMKYLPRERAFDKMHALAEGYRRVSQVGRLDADPAP